MMSPFGQRKTLTQKRVLAFFQDAREAFSQRYRPWYPKAVEVLEDDWDRMVMPCPTALKHMPGQRTGDPVSAILAVAATSSRVMPGSWDE